MLLLLQRIFSEVPDAIVFNCGPQFQMPLFFQRLCWQVQDLACSQRFKHSFIVVFYRMVHKKKLFRRRHEPPAPPPPTPLPLPAVVMPLFIFNIYISVKAQSSSGLSNISKKFCIDHLSEVLNQLIFAYHWKLEDAISEGN